MRERDTHFDWKEGLLRLDFMEPAKTYHAPMKI